MQSVLDFCTTLPERRFEAGEVLLADGEADHIVYVLIEGEVEVMKGDTLINTQSEPGAIFGELAVLLDIPHTATVRACMPTRTHVVENAGDFLQSHPDLTMQMARLLARRLNGITTYLADLKSQYEDRQDHLSMVDEVLENLLHHQPVNDHAAGSERYPDPTI